MKFSKDEENVSGVAKFEWHKLMVEHLIQRVEPSRMAIAETHHKQWDPGEAYLASCIIWTLSFRQWDPGGLCLLFMNHL